MCYVTLCVTLITLFIGRLYITDVLLQSTQPYNVNKYQPSKVAEVTDSFEKHMLASLQRQMMESGSSSSPSSSTERKANKLHQYDNESLTISSDEDTEKSTLKVG